MIKRVLISVLVLVLLGGTVGQAQEGESWTTYFPLVVCDGGDCLMGVWSIVVPEGTTNYVLNPSAETSGSYTGVGAGVLSRVTTYQWSGVYSYRLQTAANNDGGRFTLLTLSNAIHYATVRVRGTLPTSWDWSLDNATYSEPTLLKTYGDGWSLYGYEFPAAQANGANYIYMRQDGAGAGDFYLDGLQVEQKEDYWTTYCDGDQEGCEWAGAEHGSSSTRSALSRAGGRIRPLTDYDFEVSRMDGPGMPPQELGLQPYAELPGGEMTSVREGSLPFTLTGVISDEFTSLAEVHAARELLIGLFRANAYPYVNGNPQPIRFRYTGATTEKELSAHYESGLELRIDGRIPCWERVAFRFVADDPFWREIGNSAAVLDSTDTATAYIVAARLRSTGQWDNLGPPNAAGTYNSVKALAEGKDGTIYIGGDFLNFDNIADADYLVAYDPSTGTFSALNATPLGGQVWALAVDADGILWVGGAFSNAGGDADADFLCTYDPDTGAYASVNATPLNSGVYAIVIAKDNTKYIGGLFTDAGADADADRICQVDPSTGAYSSLNATPLAAGTVSALAIDRENTVLYLGGTFTNAGGDADADYVAKCTLSTGAFSSLNDDVLNGPINPEGLKIDPRDGRTLYIAGNFTGAAGGNGNGLVKYGGSSYTALGTGTSGGNPWTIHFGQNGILYIGGAFTSIGGLDEHRFARWTGSAFAHVDVVIPSTPTIYSILTTKQDPVIESNENVYVGFSTTGSMTLAGTADAENEGTAETYPTIKVSRSGGTSAKLTSIRNETLGLELQFDHDLLDGETLTIVLTPEDKKIISSFAGETPGASLPNSDFGTFHLGPGTNQITCLVINSGATVTATMEWKTQWAGCDD